MSATFVRHSPALMTFAQPFPSVLRVGCGRSMRFTALLIATCLFNQVVSAQGYDPASGKSPLVLLEAPENGVEYFQLKLRAKALHDAEEWAEAEPLLDRLVEAYPRDPGNWKMLARTKRRLKKFVEAAEAAEKAAPVLNRQGTYLEALNRYEAGQVTEAKSLLRRAIFEEGGIVRLSLLDVYPQFAPLRDDPEFRELVGNPDTTGWTRNKGWAYDLDYFYKEVKRVNPEYRNKPFPAEFERRVEELKRQAPHLTDPQIYIGMQQALAVLRQGHLSLWADPESRVPNRYLPLRFYAFPEGIFVIAADEDNQELVGSRVVALGSLTAEEALRRVAGASSADGDMEHVWGVARLAETYFLQGMGATHSSDAVMLKLQSPGRSTRSVRVATLAKEMEGRQDKLIAPDGVTPPLSLSNLDMTYWHRPLPERDALFVQVNNLHDSEKPPIETLQEYGYVLWTAINETKAKNLILDLRHNNGGTTQHYPNLLRTLIAFSRVPAHQLYVLMGRRTYSAAGNFVTDLERLANPIFVGEASSECCNLFGDPTPVRLPYSGIRGEFTTFKWNLSTPGDRRREISPDVPVQLTADAYFSGKDPVLDATFDIIGLRPDWQTTPAPY